jgi:PleD family two-component response regulator
VRRETEVSSEGAVHRLADSSARRPLAKTLYTPETLMQPELRPEESTHWGQAAWLEQVPERTRYRQEWFGRRQSVDPVRVFVIDSDVGRSAQLVAQVHAIGSFETRAASTSDSALTAAGDFLPNIVLLNTDLPDLAGYRLATTLRWHSRLFGVRLIALTSDIAGVDRRRALEAGFERYLALPVQHAALETVLRPSLQQGNNLKRTRVNRRLSA